MNSGHYNTVDLEDVMLNFYDEFENDAETALITLQRILIDPALCAARVTWLEVMAASAKSFPELSKYKHTTGFDEEIRLIVEEGVLAAYRKGELNEERLARLAALASDPEALMKTHKALMATIDELTSDRTEPEDAFVQPAASAAQGWVWSESAVAVHGLRCAPSQVEKASLRLVDHEQDIAVTVFQDGGRLHATISTDRDDLVGRVVEVQVVPDDVDSEASPLSATVELAAVGRGGCTGSADLGEAPSWMFRLGLRLVPKTDG